MPVPKKKIADDITKDPRIPAAIDLIGYTGAQNFRLQYCDDEKPVVWFALGQWGTVWEVAAGIDPATAIFRLLDQIIDGGMCTHCSRPAGFDTSTGVMPLNDLVCWYQWDPGRKIFRRGCDESKGNGDKQDIHPT